MEKSTKGIGFSLRKITTEQFAIIEEEFNEQGKIKINTSLRFGAEEIKRLFAVFSTFTFYSDQKPFIIIEIGCHFKIKEQAWDQMYDKAKNILNVSKGFISHLTMLTIGTTRGVLHSKTEGTCFNKYVLPTINVSDIIKEDFKFPFDEMKY